MVVVLDVWQLLETIAPADEHGRDGDLTAKFMQFGPWLTARDLRLMALLLDHAKNHRECRIADVARLTAAVERAMERKSAGISAYCRSVPRPPARPPAMSALLESKLTAQPAVVGAKMLRIRRQSTRVLAQHQRSEV